MTKPIFYILLLFIFLFAVLEIKSLINKRMFRELAAASLLLLLALSYGTDLAMDWMKLPNPRAMITVIKPLSQSFETLLQVNQ